MVCRSESLPMRSFCGMLEACNKARDICVNFFRSNSSMKTIFYGNGGIPMWSRIKTFIYHCVIPEHSQHPRRAKNWLFNFQMNHCYKQFAETIGHRRIYVYVQTKVYISCGLDLLSGTGVQMSNWPAKLKQWVAVQVPTQMDNDFIWKQAEGIHLLPSLLCAGRQSWHFGGSRVHHAGTGFLSDVCIDHSVKNNKGNGFIPVVWHEIIDWERINNSIVDCLCWLAGTAISIVHRPTFTSHISKVTRPSEFGMSDPTCGPFVHS